MEREHIFNSPLEAGVRSLNFLDAYYPRSLDFEQLMKVDYVLVNSADFNGPESIHPKTPNRQGELSSRRETVHSGIELMVRFNFIEVDLTQGGVFYRVTENAEPYLDLMKAPYSVEMKNVAHWLVTELNEIGFVRINEILGKRVF